MHAAEDKIALHMCKCVAIHSCATCSKSNVVQVEVATDECMVLLTQGLSTNVARGQSYLSRFYFRLHWVAVGQIISDLGHQLLGSRAKVEAGGHPRPRWPHLFYCTELETRRVEDKVKKRRRLF